MAQKTRIDLKSFVRTKIVEGQISEEITPEMHNQANDEMIDSLLNAIDDLATHSDFLSVDSTAKKYLNPYVASVYFLATGDKATQAQVLAGTVDNKYITPKSLSAALNSNFGLKDHHTDILYSEGSGVFYDNGSGISIWRANKPTSGAFAIDDWDEVATGGGGSISDLSGIPTSTATASTPTFFNASKNLISATAALLGTFYDTFASKSIPVNADTIHIGNSDSSFEIFKTTLSDLWTNYIKPKVDALLLPRTTFGNSNYSASTSDRRIVTSVAFTAPRTVTLVDGLASNLEVVVADELQTVTSTNTLTIAVPSGKKLNGVTNGTEVIRAAGGWRRLFTDGSGNYSFDAGIVRTGDSRLSDRRFGKFLDHYASYSNNTGNTTENVKYAFLIPANSVGDGGVISITGLINYISGSGNRTIKVYLSTTPDLSGVMFTIATYTQSSNGIQFFNRSMRNASGNVWYVPTTSSLSDSWNSATTAAFDYTTARYIVVTQQNVTAGNDWQILFSSIGKSN